jgi:hypothetical protein
MVNELATIGTFIIGWIVSTIIVYVITRYVFKETEGVGRAAAAAIVGTAIYSITYYFLGMGSIAAVIAGIGWLLALKWLYDIGWLRALVIAVVIWAAATVIGIFIPTLGGPI